MAKVIGGIVGVLLLIGVFFVWQGKQAAAPTESTEGEATMPKETPTTLTEQGKQALTSIRAAMGSGKQMKCTFSTGDAAGSSTASVYVSGKQFLTQATVNGVSTYALNDGDTQYVWTDNSKQGMKMGQACLESLKGSAPNAVPRDYQAELDAAKNVQCDAAEATPVSFSVPADVSFVDQCAMMQESLKMMEEAQKKLPAGMKIPNMPNVAY